MGLLTDPNAGQGKIIKLLLRFYNKLCILMYIGAIGWFCLLAHSSVSMPTYFSENALLPGLVKSEFNEGNTAKQYYSELLDEMKNHKDSIPYPWLLAKFRQIGLDTYSHNFTLNYPLGKRKKFTGRNVYGILRAPRAASTESVVLSVPYRPSSSVHPTTAPSIAVMLAFAKFANRERYWAKDIIFLVTEHEQLGIQAWLEAYHSAICGTIGTLDHGDLRGRAGAIQAAINLEIHDINVEHIDVKIEGLNGHLPNLDLVNLVHRMCSKEGVPNTFKNRWTYRPNDDFQSWKYAFETMLSMVATQSTGVPNGNHGLFHRFGIEAVTVEGFSRTADRRNTVDLFVIGRIIESLFRSLNNLLERFHQSYFFYILLSPDRFVSIGLYIPVIIVLGGALFIKSCANWYELSENFNSSEENKDEKTKEKEEKKNISTKKKEIETNKDVNKDSLELVRVGLIILVSHTIGVCVMNSPKYLAQLGIYYNLATDASIYFGFIIISLLLLILPYIIPGQNTKKNMQVLSIFTNLEMGTSIIAIGMMNFSMALFCGVIFVPVMLLITPTEKRIKSVLQKILWLLVHPFLVMSVVVMIYTYITFQNEPPKEIFYRGISATQQALVYSIVDSFIYGNWLYKVATAIFLPNWLCLWFVQFPNYNNNINSKKLN